MSPSEVEIKDAIKRFLSENFLLGKTSAQFGDNDSFLENGIVDSTGILEFIGFLQEKWDIEVADEELLPENFDTVGALSAFVLRKLSAAK